MAEYRRTNETREPNAWFADDDARRRHGNEERDDHYPYGSDRYARYESSRGSSHAEHRDDRGSHWEGAAEDRPGLAGSVGQYRTDDRIYHDRFREQSDGGLDRHDRDDRVDRKMAAVEYYRAARDQRADYLRWGQGVDKAEEPHLWQPHERGGYWRQYETSRQPDFAGRGPKDYQRSDTRIREEICDRMTDDPRLDASQISVEVKGGEVMLTGSVTSRDQKRRAEDVADLVSGVKDVTNQLRVMRDGMVHDGFVDASGLYGHETTSSQPAHEVSRATPSKSTSNTTT